MFFGRIFLLGVSFFVGIYIARYLGPSNYGLLNYVTSFVGLFGFLASFGIDSIVSREIIKDYNKKDKIIGTGFYIKITGGLFAIICILITAFLTTTDVFTIGLIGLFSLNFVPQAFNIIETFFQSQVLSKKVVVAQISANLISTTLKILVIFLGKGIFWLMIIYIIETSIYALLLLISFRKFGDSIEKWSFDINIATSLLKDSWPLMLSAVAFGIYMKIDQIMIKNMLGNEQTGIYAVAVKLSEIWYFLPSIICASVFPVIIKTTNISKGLFENRMKKLYFLMFWLAFIISLFITIFSRPIINILFGTQYLSAVTTLQIYVWASIGVFLGVAINQYLLASNLTKISFYNTLIGALINVILNVILIPKMGINGAAIATLISYIFATFGIFISNKSRSHGLLILKSIISYK
jgi:O-antigen/teichoic acid export membrane protein